jgi:Family of unknown function (DUF6232)
MARILFRQDLACVTETHAEFNGRRFTLSDYDGAHLEVDVEHAQRLGNILVGTLAGAAALYFFVPIQIGLWQSKFYFAVGMFGLLALVILDDVRRSNSLKVHRLVLTRQGERHIAYATTDGRMGRQLERAVGEALSRAREHPVTARSA